MSRAKPSPHRLSQAGLDTFLDKSLAQALAWPEFLDLPGRGFARTCSLYKFLLYKKQIWYNGFVGLGPEVDSSILVNNTYFYTALHAY